MDSKNVTPELPEALELAMQNVIRVATSENYAIIGLVFRDKPEPSVAILRNTKDDPVEMFKAASELVENLITRNGSVEHLVTPLN